MKLTLQEVPHFMRNALQGLAFWIGHRHALFRGYPLTEGALVAEACNLIQANLDYQTILLPECMYKNLVRNGNVIPDVTPNSRADLVLCNSAAKSIGREGNISQYVKFVIEVKRELAPDAEINLDLKRLHNFLSVSQGSAVRAFLFVISESSAPKRFVKDGKSIPNFHTIPDCNGKFKVRRTVKAAASFHRYKTANYVCLIEVFS